MVYLDDKGLKVYMDKLNQMFQPVLASRSEFDERAIKEPGRYIAVMPYKDTKSGRVVFVYEDLPQEFLDEVDIMDDLTF